MKTFNVVSAAVVALCLGACSGGGGAGGTNVFDGTGAPAAGASSPTAAVAGSMMLTLSSQTVTSAAPVTVSAKLVDAKGNGLAGQVIAFSSIAKLGDFSAPSALTDASGIATVALFPAATATAKAGADTVVASATVGGTEVKVSLGFQLTATNVTISDFSAPSVTLGSKLAPYGQADLVVSLSGAANGTPVAVSLSSLCVGKGKALLTPPSTTTTNGKATFTYKDAGCGATEVADTLQASITGSVVTKSLNLNLSSPAVSSVTFSSATPEIIYLKGSGLTETSLVVFQVRDLAGNPLPNQDVTLEPNTLIGGLTIDGGLVPVVKKSDSNGNVSVRVNSGTVPTPMRVKATLGGAGGITTVSSSLSIAVGLPSQLNFSLSQVTTNMEAYNRDGTPNTYSVIASDRLGNPVSPGTAISFVAEGGQVMASAQTVLNGGLAQASASFVSSEPRPANGRVTVLAYALGEESFIDANGNNVYDPGEAFQDLGAPFLNRAFDNVFNSVTDQFFALDSSTSACAAVDPAKDPLLLLAPQLRIPSRPATCDGKWGRAYVRRSIETIFSTSQARPFLLSPETPACAKAIELKINSAGSLRSYNRLLGAVIANASKTGFVTILAADANSERLNPMAAGTNVTVEASTGLTVKVTGGAKIPNANEATAVGVEYEFSGTTTSGTITASFESPNGLKTSIPFTVTQGAAPSSCPP